MRAIAACGDKLPYSLDSNSSAIAATVGAASEDPLPTANFTVPGSRGTAVNIRKPGAVTHTTELPNRYSIGSRSADPLSFNAATTIAVGVAPKQVGSSSH